jgi:hypothetical protein
VVATRELLLLLLSVRFDWSNITEEVTPVLVPPG